MVTGQGGVTAVAARIAILLTHDGVAHDGVTHDGVTCLADFLGWGGMLGVAATLGRPKPAPLTKAAP